MLFATTTVVDLILLGLFVSCTYQFRYSPLLVKVPPLAACKEGNAGRGYCCPCCVFQKKKKERAWSRLDCISDVGGMDPNAGRANPKYAISLL